MLASLMLFEAHGFACRSSQRGGHQARSRNNRAPRSSRAQIPSSSPHARQIWLAETELIAICKSQKALATADPALQPFTLDYLHYAMHALEFAMLDAELPWDDHAWTRVARHCFWYAIRSDAPSKKLQYTDLIKPLDTKFW